ncbi:MAG: ABC transporter substrate-binding protein [Pseudomonadales bacterium]|nr:ABC transporter substrate-binding protein [Pseudomonadales bacterium]
MKVLQSKGVRILGAAMLCMAASSLFNASMAACEHKVGAVLSLTGAYGAHGVPISRAAQLGVEQVNEARAALGVGCELVYDVRDSNTQASVAVDAARKLIDLDGVTALVGPISSGITAPLLSSVTVEKDVVVVATASTSSTFTNMGKRGETKGLFFRTLSSDSLQAVAAAMMAYEAGFRKPAIIYFNNDWGKNNQAGFIDAFKALGGEIGNSVPFNPDQPSYRSEITKTLEGDPDSLYMLSNTQDGVKHFRDWIRFDGPQNFIMPQGMNDSAFVDTVGADLLKNAWFISPGTPANSSLEKMESDFQVRWDATPKGPGRNSGYDAGVLIGLAMVTADMRGLDTSGSTLAKIIREITGPDGEEHYGGVDGLKAAIKAIKAGKNIWYVGATGPIDFDPYGDVATPFVMMKIKDGDYVDVGGISLEEVSEVKAKVRAMNN